MTWIFLLAIALAFAGYRLACHFTGESLLAAWWDEWRLGKVSLEQLDDHWVRRPATDMVVSLTTIPSRIDLLQPTLKSLLRQSIRPAEIRLCLPDWSEREQRAYVVPAWLAGLKNITVVRCADAGPATKFLSTLRPVAPDRPVLVLDDDRIYHPRLVEKLAELARAHPDEVVSVAGWDAPADRVDRPTTLWRRLRAAPHVPVRANQLREPRPVDIVQGVHGYVVRPRFFDLEELADFGRAPAALRHVDDVWISAHCRVPRVVHPLRLPYTDYKAWAGRRAREATSLGGTLNRADRDESRGNSVALRHFSDRWRIRADQAGSSKVDGVG